MPGHKIYAS